MKVIKKEMRSTPLSNDVIYKMDSLSKVEDIDALFSSLKLEGYILKRYVLNFVHDHADFRSNVSGNSFNEFTNILLNVEFKDLDSVDVIMGYANIDAYGTIYPDSGIFRISFLKKNGKSNIRNV